MEKIDNKLKKGQLFLYKVDNLNKVSIDFSDEYTIFNEKIDEDVLNGNYLLFMYLGSGLARECYTSNIFNVVDKNKRVVCNDYLDFLNKFENSLRNPLSIIIDEETSIYKANNNYNDVKKDIREIRLTINQLEKQVKKELLDKLDEMVNNDIDSYNLKKTLK